MYDSGVVSWLPAGSVASTSKMWLPSASGPVVTGLVQAFQAPPSRLHSKVEPPSLAENSKVGVVSLVGSAGTTEKDESGATVSTVQV